MLQRVEKSEIRVGMFVEAVEGAWAESALQKRRFAIESLEQIRLLNASNISGVFINTTLGSGLGPSHSTAISKSRHTKEAAFAEHLVATCSKHLHSAFNSIRATEKIDISIVEPVVDHLARSMERNHNLLIEVTRLKADDTGTFLHSISVSALLLHLARYLKFDDEVVKNLGLAGILHDIGKLAIPAQVLTKQGALAIEERTIIETHPILGYELLKKNQGISPIILDVCRHHHERVDGNGYPDMLSLAQLSVYARMSAICDVYDAITSVRPYRQPWTPEAARAWMLGRPGHFDPQLLVKFFLSIA